MANDDFSEQHRAYTEATELEGRRILDQFELEPDSVPSLNNDALLAAIYKETGNAVLRAADKLKKATDPKSAFKASFGALDELEQQRFVNDNVLEGLKRGNSASEILKRFQSLGLIASSHPKAPTPALSPAAAPAPEPINSHSGSILRWLQARLRNAGLCVLGATENALGSLADEADIEFGITFELGVPKPFLTFKANKKAREVIRILRDKVDA